MARTAKPGAATRETTSATTSAPTGDRRVRRTQATLQAALIALVAERDLAQLNVADIADRADVSRSTFYDHYRDVHELAEAACTTILDDMFQSVLAIYASRDHRASPSQDPDPALTAFFAHFAEHAGLYRSLLGPTGSARVIEHVRRHTTAAFHYGRLALAAATPPRDTADSPDYPLDVPAAFVAGALLGVATDWLQRGCPRTPLQMTTQVKPQLLALRGTVTPPAANRPS